MLEKIFNIFIFVETIDNEEYCFEYGMSCYEVNGDDEFMSKFLLSQINADYQSSKRFKIKLNSDDITVNEANSWRIISTLLNFRSDLLFEEGFSYYDGPREPFRALTQILNGKPMITEPVPKIPRNTFNSLVARGIDNVTAKKLILKGHTIKTLSQLTKPDLINLGISEYHADKLDKLSRPPIPEEIVLKLLYESRRTCCVCRDNSKPIIIHHIEEWSLSKNHSEENLVVLCLDDHDKAHTKKELSLNLSKSQIRNFKDNWIKKVAYEDSKVVLGIINNSKYSRWDYVNINRLFELVFQLNIDFEDIKTYTILKTKGIVNSMGTLEDSINWRISQAPEYFFIDCGEAIFINWYLKTLVERVIEKTAIIDITNRLNVSELNAIVKPGRYIMAQLGFYFQDLKLTTDNNGIHMRKAYYKGNGIKIEFVFDSWYCTSSSAKFDHLCNHKIITPLLFVKGVQKVNKLLVINCSCIAIGSWFDNYRINENIDVMT